MSQKLLFALVLLGALAFLPQRGSAQEPGSVLPSWPIENGIKHQPTQGELRALHEQDVTPKDARELDRLYDELMSSGNVGTHHTGIARMR
jgi:hypothetical protein